MQAQAQPLDLVTNRLKQLQMENVKIKERIEEIVKGRDGLIEKIDKTGFKLGMQEADYFSQKQNLAKELQTKEEEMQDWKNVLQATKEDLLKKQEELKKSLEEIRQNNESLNKTKDTLYEEFEKKRLDGIQKEREEAKRLEKIPKDLDEIVASVSVEKSGGFLTLISLRQIFDGLAIYVSQTFCQLINDYRKERRARNYNNPDFVEAFQEFEKKTKTLMGNKQQEFMDRLKIPADLLGKSINHHASQGHREVLQLYPMLASKLRSFKESDKVLEKEQIKDILSLKEKLLRERKEGLIDLLKEAAKAKLLPEQIYSVMQFKLSDEIEKQLNIEEEDITKAMKTLENMVDSDIQELSMKVAQATNEVMIGLRGEK